MYAVTTTSNNIVDSHSPETFLELPVVLFSTLRRAFQVILALAPGDLRHVALHQQTVDVLVRVPASTLMDGFRTFAQRQRRNTVILRDYEHGLCVQRSR